MRISQSVYFYPTSDRLDFSDEYLSSNAVLIDGPEKLLIDPGFPRRWPELKNLIEADGLAPAGIKTVLFSHSHPDHLEAGPVVAGECRADLALSGPELDFLKNAGQEFFPPPNRIGLIDYPYTVLEEGGFDFGGHRLELFLTPGHSPGGLTLHFPAEKVLAVGDLYFPGTIGAIDMPGGCPGEMYASVGRLQSLAGVESVLCGHGPAILGRENVLANYELLNAEIAEKIAAGII